MLMYIAGMSHSNEQHFLSVLQYIHDDGSFAQGKLLFHPSTSLSPCVITDIWQRDSQRCVIDILVPGATRTQHQLFFSSDLLRLC
jgi:hypothetical protein